MLTSDHKEHTEWLKRCITLKAQEIPGGIVSEMSLGLHQEDA